MIQQEVILIHHLKLMIHTHQVVNQVRTLLDRALCMSRSLSSDEKYLLLTTVQANELGKDLDVQFFGGRKRKQIIRKGGFQWLHYL